MKDGFPIKDQTHMLIFLLRVHWKNVRKTHKKPNLQQQREGEAGSVKELFEQKSERFDMNADCEMD